MPFSISKEESLFYTGFLRHTIINKDTKINCNSYDVLFFVILSPTDVNSNLFAILNGSTKVYVRKVSVFRNKFHIY